MSDLILYWVRFFGMRVDEARMVSGKEVFRAGAVMRAMRGSFWRYRHGTCFCFRSLGGVLRILVCVEIVLIVGMKEFGKFIWRDNKKELISVFGCFRKVLCKCMKSEMRRHESDVQKAKYSS